MQRQPLIEAKIKYMSVSGHRPTLTFSADPNHFIVISVSVFCPTFFVLFFGTECTFDLVNFHFACPKWHSSPDRHKLCDF